MASSTKTSSTGPSPVSPTSSEPPGALPLPRLVLLRPRNADNLGAVARAMKNFGLSDWVVVAPNPGLLEAPGLHRLAVKSGELLESVRRVDTLQEAVADCTWIVGTTTRLVEGRRRLAPRALAEALALRADERWALVFGDERHGLRREDLAACHALSTIPASASQPSLNLAQAVVVYAYELGIAHRGGARGSPGPTAALADDTALRAVRSALEGALERVGFLRNQGTRALDDAMQTLIRAQLTRREAGLWSAIAHVVAKRG